MAKNSSTHDHHHDEKGHSHSHHGHHHHHHDHRNIARAAAHTIALTLALNLSFVFIEIFGAWWTGSVAILADAVHDAGDCLSLAMAWVLQRLSLKAKNNAFSYGYGRLSLLGALASGMAISLGSIAILFAAIPRLWNPGVPHGQGMMIIAVLGIVFNGLAAYRLLGGKTINERVLVWHFVEDVLGWVAVLIGGACVYFFEWFWVDPVLAILISVFVVYNLVRNLRYSARLFLQSVPSGFVLESFQAEVKKLTGVADVHDIHSWSLDGNQHILSLHVQVAALSPVEIMQLKAKIREIARAQGDFHVTIEIETQVDECGDRC